MQRSKSYGTNSDCQQGSARMRNSRLNAESQSDQSMQAQERVHVVVGAARDGVTGH